MIVHVGDRLSGGLGEKSGYDRVNQASESCANKRYADPYCADAMSGPTHSKRARVLDEQSVCQSRMILNRLLRRHFSGP